MIICSLYYWYLLLRSTCWILTKNSQIIADDNCLLFYWLIILRSLFCVVTGPSGPVNLEFDPRDGKGHFMAKEFGMHEVIVTNEGEAVKGAPNYIR